MSARIVSKAQNTDRRRESLRQKISWPTYITIAPRIDRVSGQTRYQENAITRVIRVQLRGVEIVVRTRQQHVLS